MGFVHAEFDALAWCDGAHPLESKKVAPAGLTLLKFEPGFADPNWCARSHVLFVTQGVLNVELSDKNVAVSAGQAIWLPAGTRHRASVTEGQSALVFAASDLQRVEPDSAE
jgi:quercetin dioxygenase-like cupin family protein